MAVTDISLAFQQLQQSRFSPSTPLVYVMRAIQNGTTTVYWENIDSPDDTGTGPNAPPGVLTDIITIAIEAPADRIVGTSITLAIDQIATGTDGTRNLGGFRFATSDFTLTRFKFGVVLSTSNASFAASAELYNVTDAESVSFGGPTSLSTTSLSPTIIESPDLTVGAGTGHLRSGATIYEVRLSSASASGLDLAVLDSAWIQVL